MGPVGRPKRTRNAHDDVDQVAPGYIPIARLLAIAYRSLIDALHEELAIRGVDDMRPTYAFVMLAARQTPLGINEVGELLGFTKQAASKLVDCLENDGYVRRIVHASDARSRQIELTKKGRHVLEIVESIYQNLEHEWGAIVTHRHVEIMRSDLIRILRAQNNGSLPAIRPTW